MPEDHARRTARQAGYMVALRAVDPEYGRRFEVHRCLTCPASIRIRVGRAAGRCGSCSRRLAALLGQQAKRDRRLPVLHPAPVRLPRARPAAPSARPLRRRWYAGRCEACGGPFIHDQPQTTTCSRTCAKRKDRTRRRALEHGAAREPFRPIDIFERDQWTCRLCDLPLARGEVVPHPLAPTIDHVIPLSRGGAHAPWNVQAAHFLCNCAKSDRVAEGVA